MLRGVCIHSHFYQPPREDPWLDFILKDPTATPYHDWNECVYEQCYKPNMGARLLDMNGHIVHIVSNYRHLSFNVGPTLHRWIAQQHPHLASGILKADMDARDSLGEGGAIAQAYNHIILPLASEDDIRTQVRWGAADFEHRFGRKPAGMWLPETAVDIATLEALADEGISFTILAPHQCAAVSTPSGSWTETPGGRGLDVTRPYLLNLPSGKSITIVFYFGSIAHDIAFGGLLDNGDFFAEALLAKVPRDSEPRLLTIATDGETYGHHHHFGEMALARATQRIYDSQDVMLTNIAHFLELYPATRMCRIEEDTSWSCAHGVERWRSDCGCHTGGEPWWDQSWRAPLRDALDKIRDRMDEIFDRSVKEYCDSPWKLRDDAVALYLDDFGEDAAIQPIRERKEAFVRSRCGAMRSKDVKRVLALIESQRMRMFMYTSCGWFFNDVAGVETRQIMAYALRAIEHVRDVSGIDLEGDFLRDLALVRGNTVEFPTASDVVTRTVLPNRRTIREIAASAALLGATKTYHVYGIKSSVREYPSGNMNLRVSSMEVIDTRTLENWRGSAMVISTGGLDDVCRLSENPLPDQEGLWRNYYMGDIFSMSKFIEQSFELGPWHFTDLTTDDKDKIAAERTSDAEAEHMDFARQLLEDNQRLLVQLSMMGVKSSAFLSSAGDFAYSKMLDELCSNTGEILDLLETGSKLETLLSKARDIGVYPKVSVLAPRMESAFYDNLVEADRKNDEKAYLKLLSQWERAVELRIEIDKWRLQNLVWSILWEGGAKPCAPLLELAGALGFALPKRIIAENN
jgi:alpha-amylase/alpha-mannosidase (GH57 family)